MSKKIFYALSIFMTCFFISKISYSQVRVIAPITTNNAQDTYPTHYDTLGYSGYMTFQTITNRNNIPNARRSQGMLVYVVQTDSLYQLQSDLITWKAYKLGQGQVLDTTSLSNRINTNATNITSKLNITDTTNKWQVKGNYLSQLIAGGGILTSGDTITNTAPDKIVSLTGTNGVTISGTYPTFNISGPGTSSDSGKVFVQYGLINVNDSTIAVDSTIIASKNWVNNQGFLKTYVKIDTTSLSNRIDTNTVNIANKLNITDTVLLARKSGIYPSLTSGNTQTFNGQFPAYYLNYNNLSNKPTLFSGSYHSLTDTPFIPTNNNQLPNGAGYFNSLIAGAGISVSGNTITNTAPNQILSLTGLNGITISGTYPSFTITGQTIPKYLSKIYASYGLINVNDSTLKADTTLLSSKTYVQNNYQSKGTYLIPSDTASLSNRINTKQDSLIAGTNITIAGNVISGATQKTDTTSLSNRINTNATNITLKLNITDTTSKWQPLGNYKMNYDSLLSTGYVSHIALNDSLNKIVNTNLGNTDLTNSATLERYYDLNNKILSFYNPSGINMQLNGNNNSFLIQNLSSTPLDSIFYASSTGKIKFSHYVNNATEDSTLTVDQSGNLILKKFVGGGGTTIDTTSLSNRINSKADTSQLFSGSYNDLTNKPTLFSGSYTDLTNKPTLFSGSYNDLTNKPVIPAQVNLIGGNNINITGNYPNLTIASTQIDSSVNASYGLKKTVSNNNISLQVDTTNIVSLNALKDTLKNKIIIDTTASVGKLYAINASKGIVVTNGANTIINNDVSIAADTTVMATNYYINSQGFLKTENDPIWNAAKSGNTTITGNWNFTNGLTLLGYNNMGIISSDSSWNITSRYGGNGQVMLIRNAVGTSNTDSWHQIAPNIKSVAIALNTSGNAYLLNAPMGEPKNIFDSFWVSQSILATQPWVQSQNYMLRTDLNDSLQANALDVLFPLTLNATNKTLSADTTQKDSSLVNYRQMKQYVSMNAPTYTLPTASTTTLGGVKVDGSSITINGSGVISATSTGSGSVTSVGLSAPAGFSVSGSPVTTSGTLALSFASGYSLPTIANQTSWTNKVNISDSAAMLAPYAFKTSLGQYKLNSDSTSLTGYVSHNALNNTLAGKIIMNAPTDSISLSVGGIDSVLGVGNFTTKSLALGRLSPPQYTLDVNGSLHFNNGVAGDSSFIRSGKYSGGSPFIKLGVGVTNLGSNNGITFDSSGTYINTATGGNIAFGANGSVQIPFYSNTDTTKFLTANSSGQFVFSRSYLNLQNVTSLDSATNHQLVVQGQNIGSVKTKASIWFGSGIDTQIGTGCTFIGQGSGSLNDFYSYNTALGYGANSQPRGSYNIGIGTDIFGTSEGGGYALNGYNIYIGNNLNTNAASDSNSIVIGQNENGKGSNTTLIGTPSTTANYFYGAITTTGALLGNSASITNNLAAGGIITAKNLSATGQLSIADTVVTSNFTISSTHSLYICNSSSGITATLSTTDVNWNGSPLVIIKNIGTGTITLTNTWTSDPTTIAAGASEILAMVDISGTTYWIKLN